MTNTKETLRVVRFRPYRKGMGPVFKLTTWDPNRTGFGGRHVVGYRLSIGVGGYNVAGNPAAWEVLFEGEDFGCSPLHAIDADECLKAIMTFLTLRPGDTADYFADYTQAQLDYCSHHAEALASAVRDRLGD